MCGDSAAHGTNAVLVDIDDGRENCEAFLGSRLSRHVFVV